MRNRYKGICYYCGKVVEPKQGHFERDYKSRTWRTIHADCVFKQRREKEKQKALEGLE